MFGGMDVVERRVVITRADWMLYRYGVADSIRAAKYARDDVQRLRTYLKGQLAGLRYNLRRVGQSCYYHFGFSPLTEKNTRQRADRDWFLFTSYSGLPGGPSLRELGDMVGITGEVVRQRVKRLAGPYVRTFGKKKFVPSVIADESWTPEQQYREFAELTSE